MKYYILKTIKGVDLRIDETQKAAVLKALDEDKVYIQLGSQDSLIMLKSIGQIVPEEIVREEERLQLASTGRVKCDKCGKAYFESEGCFCWEQKKDELREATERKLMLPGSIQEGLQKIASKMALPQATYDEVLNERALMGEKRARAIIKRSSLHPNRI